MDWRESLRQAYESVADHPRRVFASSMGVLWGAAAIVVLLGWGTGFREFMRVELGRFGEGFVMLFPATTSSGFPGHRKGVQVRISRDDAAAAERDGGESVRALLACHNSRERLLVESDVGQIRRLDLSACDERFLALRKFEIEHGRGFDAVEAERGAAVAVLGPEAAEQLFGSPQAALGRTLRVSGKPFQVIGVPKRKGRQYFNTHRPDNRMLVIPAASAEERLGYDPQAANFFLLFPRRGGSADDAARAVLRVWGPRAGFHPDDADAIKRFSSYELLGLVDLFYAGFMIFIGVAGTVTLLIGGVGIANVHLATLAERTVEIGADHRGVAVGLRLHGGARSAAGRRTLLGAGRHHGSERLPAPDPLGRGRGRHLRRGAGGGAGCSPAAGAPGPQDGRVGRAACGDLGAGAEPRPRWALLRPARARGGDPVRWQGTRDRAIAVATAQ
ncbi:MAG: ABC transporter permease [Deltaproteobacteria bacterium]|nr:ABC transporter permease [Deltaproteobacteria bacterium]